MEPRTVFARRAHYRPFLVPLGIIASVIEKFPKRTQWRHMHSIELDIYKQNSAATFRKINSDRFPNLTNLRIAVLTKSVLPTIFNFFHLRRLPTLVKLTITLEINRKTTGRLTCPRRARNSKCWRNVRELSLCGQCKAATNGTRTSESVGMALRALETLTLDSNNFGILRGLSLVGAPLTNLTLRDSFLSSKLRQQVSTRDCSSFCHAKDLSVLRGVCGRLGASVMQNEGAGEKVACCVGDVLQSNEHE